MTVCFVETIRARNMREKENARYEALELQEDMQIDNVESFVEGEHEYIICRKYSVHSDYEVVRLSKAFYHLAFVTSV